MQEKRLIEKVQKGNKREFKKLYDANASALFRFLMQFSKDKDIVSDWVQRAFIKAYLNINNFSYHSKFSTWLFQIALNEMKADFRKTSNKKFLMMDDNFSHEDENTLIDDFEWFDDMKWLLSELDENKKAVFVLHEVEGYKHLEIAEILDISQVASRTILSRTKKILKSKWQDKENINVKQK